MEIKSGNKTSTENSTGDSDKPTGDAAFDPSGALQAVTFLVMQDELGKVMKELE